MTDKTTHAAGPDNFVPAIDIAPLLEANQRAVRAFADTQRHLIDRSAKMNREIFRFITRRLDEERETARALAACKTAPEAAAVCGAFFETAVKQYSEEAGLLAGYYADQAEEALEDAQHQVEEAMEPAKDTPQL